MERDNFIMPPMLSGVCFAPEETLNRYHLICSLDGKQSDIGFISFPLPRNEVKPLSEWVKRQIQGGLANQRREGSASLFPTFLGCVTDGVTVNAYFKGVGSPVAAALAIQNPSLDRLLSLGLVKLLEETASNIEGCKVLYPEFSLNLTVLPHKLSSRLRTLPLLRYGQNGCMKTKIDFE